MAMELSRNGARSGRMKKAPSALYALFTQPGHCSAALLRLLCLGDASCIKDNADSQVVRPSASDVNVLSSSQAWTSKIGQRSGHGYPFHDPGALLQHLGLPKARFHSSAVVAADSRGAVVAKDQGDRTYHESREALSKNAQFRAVRPDPAILEYIDRHLLGRRRPGELIRAGYKPREKCPLDNTPHLQKGIRSKDLTIFKYSPKFEAAASVAESIPAPKYPEVAFAGRSNVGKSSLINALSRRGWAARTSDKPGTTQSILFFSVNSRLCLVDLPGYGFAFAAEEKKEQWNELVRHYVCNRPSLTRVCLLVDSRHGFKPGDVQTMDLLEEAGTRYQVVLTKADQLPPLDLARRATLMQRSLSGRRHHVDPLMMVSATTGAGIMKLRATLAGLAIREPVKEKPPSSVANVPLVQGKARKIERGKGTSRGQGRRKTAPQPRRSRLRVP